MTAERRGGSQKMDRHKLRQEQEASRFLFEEMKLFGKECVETSLGALECVETIHVAQDA